MNDPVRVTRSTRVGADPADVWERVVTAEGINHELRPVLTMTMPRRHRHRTIADVPVGVPLGRATLRLFGVLPVEYDDLVLLAVDPPRAFHERSSMATARVWDHHRRLEPLPGGGTRVTDTILLVPRLPLPALVRRLLGAGIRALFAHRHRRLARWASSRPAAR